MTPHAGHAPPAPPFQQPSSLLEERSFVEARELKDDKRLQSLLEAKGWVRIDGPGDENIVYRHTPTGAIIRDAHTGNILVKGQELYPIDVIVTDLGSLTDAERTTK